MCTRADGFHGVCISYVEHIVTDIQRYVNYVVSVEQLTLKISFYLNRRVVEASCFEFVDIRRILIRTKQKPVNNCFHSQIKNITFDFSIFHELRFIVGH